ncbi:MAG: hypothetical protein ACKOOG_08155 [Actinomycetota bacterium]
MSGRLVIRDDADGEVELAPDEAERLWRVTGGLDGATVSACPWCRSRVLAAVALVDVLDAAPALERAAELEELADDAPTSHLYVADPDSPCGHGEWRDPLFDEWCDVIEGPGPPAVR